MFDLGGVWPPLTTKGLPCKLCSKLTRGSCCTYHNYSKFISPLSSSSILSRRAAAAPSTLSSGECCRYHSENNTLSLQFNNSTHPANRSVSSWPAYTKQGLPCKLCSQLSPGTYCKYHGDSKSSKPWPAYTKHGLPCRLCQSESPGNHCRYHSDQISSYSLPPSTHSQQWPAITKRGLPCKLCSKLSFGHYCQYHNKFSESSVVAPIIPTHPSKPQIHSARLSLPLVPQATPSPQSPETQSIPLSLSQQQYEILCQILQGKSLFFTGSAGTGKSYLFQVLRQIITNLSLLDVVAFTASTGCAASLIQGQTIHSWSALPPRSECGPVRALTLGTDETLHSHTGNEDDETISTNKSRRAFRSIRRTRLLVIDECSMLSAAFLDALSAHLSAVRGDRRPFGGLQVVLSGDFFQLPPVIKGNVPPPLHASEMGSPGGDDDEGASHFCFSSVVWKQLFGPQNIYVLSQVVRQNKNPEFVQALNEMRQGIVSPQTEDLLRRCSAPPPPPPLDPTAIGEESRPESVKLFCRNRDVERINQQRLASLSGPIFTFEARDTPQYDPQISHRLNSDTRAQELLELKVGAQVMLLRNIDVQRGLANGSVGIVTGFSQARPPSHMADTDTLMHMHAETDSDSDRPLPIVTFADSLVRTIYPETFTIYDGESVVGERRQIPLNLAWAVTIHKAQGMTIHNLEVDLDGVFEHGQAYVALSRVTSLENLVIRGYRRDHVHAHPAAIRFYHSLSQRMSPSLDLEQEQDARRSSVVSNSSVEVTVQELEEMCRAGPLATESS